MKTQATRTRANEVERSTMFVKRSVTIATNQGILQDFAVQESKTASLTQFMKRMIMWLMCSTSTDQDQKVQGRNEVRRSRGYWTLDQVCISSMTKTCSKI
jgi:hypothetical protein